MQWNCQLIVNYSSADSSRWFYLAPWHRMVREAASNPTHKMDIDLWHLSLKCSNFKPLKSLQIVMICHLGCVGHAHLPFWMRFSEVMIAMSSRWHCSARPMLKSPCWWNQSSQFVPIRPMHFLNFTFGAGWHEQSLPEGRTSSNMEFQHWDFLCLFMPQPHQFIFDQICAVHFA